MNSLDSRTLGFLIAAGEARWLRHRRKRASRKRTHRRRWKGMVKALGGECAVCHADENLSLDHIDGRTWDVRRLNLYDRVSRYYREWQAGVRVRLLCIPCNSRHRPAKEA